ncbi:hypothetical protein KR222_011300, partial [Zaprionus bogoriensis]
TTSASATTSATASAVPTAAATASPPGDAPSVGASLMGYGGDLLRPYMGLLPLEQPHDPWTEKAYDPHYPLFTGGGSYEAYLRPRRDTHILDVATPTARHMLTPGMLERLLRIKNEFQRRFPQLYQGMLNHHTNQTRVEVKPPLLVRHAPIGGLRQRLQASMNEPVYELGAAERGLFEEEEEAAAEESGEASTERVEEQSGKQWQRQQEKEQEQEEEQEQEQEQEQESRKQDDTIDPEVDYFHFEDDDSDNEQQQRPVSDN